MKPKHVGFRNEKLFCFHCGTSQELPLPIPADLAAEWLKGFDKIHRNCPKTWTEPVNEANENTERENCYWWLQYGEHGISSKTMFHYLADGFNIQLQCANTPSDPDDFRRCYLLLKAIPQFRSKLDRLKSVNETWSKLVDSWDKLTEMLEEQMTTKKANGMYEFMKSLGC